MQKTHTSHPEKLYFTYPNTVAVICVKLKNKVYLMSAVWQIPLSYDPMLFGVLVSPKRNTFKKIKKARHFTLNYFTYEYASLVAQLGSWSGRDIDKVKKFDVKLSDSLTIPSPFLKDAFVSLECDTVNEKIYGDHVLFSAQVKQIWYDNDAFSNNILNLKKVKPLQYIGNHTFTSTDANAIIVCQKR